MMTFQDYIKTLIPVIELNLKEKEADKKNYKSRQIWYLYRQFFYGFSEFLEAEEIYWCSAGALKLYKSITGKKDLYLQTWKNQPKFDTGRKIFNLDHIYTGEMFRNDMEKLYSSNSLNGESIEQIIRNNYRMCWILKEEEKRLPRSKRGLSLKEAEQLYEEKEIIICKLCHDI